MLLTEEVNTVGAEHEVLRAAELSAAQLAFRRARDGRVALDPFDHLAASSWSPSSSFGWKAYARGVLWAIASQPETGIDYARANRYFRVLEKLMRANTIYPFLSPDYEGGLTIEWSTGEWLLEIDLEECGEYFLLHTDFAGVAQMRERGRVGELDTESLLPLLADFSTHVSQVNPEWRRHFR